MRVFPVCSALCLVVLLGLCTLSPALAAGYFVESVPVYQLNVSVARDPDTFTPGDVRDCILTTSLSEMAAAIGRGWERTGIVCYVSPVQAPGTIPLYRLYNAAITDHVCTSSWEERQRVMRMGYVAEGVVGYVYARDAAVTAMTPLHRFYAGGNESFHTYSLDLAPTGGGTYEGVECLVWPRKTRITSISLTAPKSGEELKGASQYDISWNSSTRGGYVCINYSADGGSTWRPVECGIENKGFFTWTVPNVATRHGRLQVVWTDALFGPTNLLGIAESPLDFKIASVRLAIPRRIMRVTTQTLPSPTGLKAKLASASKITLTWKPAPGEAEGYILERRAAPGPFLQIAHLRASESSYSDDHLTPGTRYQYRLRAYGPGVNSANSMVVTASTASSLRRAITKGNGPIPPKQRVRPTTAQ